jgi:tyrosine-protein kinase Etk/Wzc
LPQYELNIRDYLRIFRKHKLIILITFATVTIISFFYLSGESVQYRASATVKIEERKTIAGLLTEWIVFNPADVMESETKAITGYPVMKNVVFKLGLAKEDSPLEEINNEVSKLQGSIETERLGATNMIRITATSDDANKAMELVNAVAQVYIEENLREKAKQARQARQFIEDQLSTLEERLNKAEERLKEFGNEVKNIRLADPIEKKLVDLEFELAELLQKYTEKHPRVMQLKAQIEGMEKQTKGFSAQELDYARLTREVEVNRKLYAMLKEKLEEARITEAQKISDVSIVDPAVVPGAPVSTNKQVGILMGALVGLILGIAFSFVRETLDTSIGTIQDVENLLQLPVLGVVPSIEHESEKRKGTFSKIRDKLMPSPKSEAELRYMSLISHYEPKSPAAESFRNIHTNLKLNSSNKVVLVTSSGPNEGKTGVVTNLGIVMAQTGLKTLLVCADLRRPRLNKIFGIKREPGLTEIIMGTAVLEDALNNITDIMLGDLGLEDIRKTPGIENISIITTGHLPLNPVEILESKKLTDFIDKIKAKFDVVIFDSPPVLPVTDASLIAPKLDSVILVYEMGRTSRDALLRSKIQLESVGAKISGLVLNHTRPQTETFSSYPYYSNKYKYYGKEERGKGRKDAEKEKEI